MQLNRPTNYLLRSTGSTDLEPIGEENIQQEFSMKIHPQTIMNNPAEAAEVYNQVNL